MVTYIDLICQEYVAIVNYIIDSGHSITHNENRILVERKIVETMMNRNSYLPSQIKLNMWKSLNLINTEAKKTTWQYIDPDTKKRKRVINIIPMSYQALKNYVPKPIKNGAVSRKVYDVIFRNNVLNIPKWLYYEVDT